MIKHDTFNALPSALIKYKTSIHTFTWVCVCIDCVCVCVGVTGNCLQVKHGKHHRSAVKIYKFAQLPNSNNTFSLQAVLFPIYHDLKSIYPVKKISSLIHFKKERAPSLFIKQYSLWNKLPSPAPYPLLVLQRICCVIVLSLVYMACILPVHPVELTKQNVFIKNDSSQQR